MANLTQIKNLHVDDVDSTTMKALKLNTTTQSPWDFTIGDTTPTGIQPNHLHHHTGSGKGRALYRAQPGLTAAGTMISTTYVVYDFFAPAEGPTAATGTIEVTLNPTISGDTIQIGGSTYTLKTSLDGSFAFDVLIGGDETATALNLRNAIMNHVAGSGTTYNASTPQHPSVVAAVTGAKVTVTSRLTGTLGNSIQLVKDETTGDGTYVISGATLGVSTNDTVVLGGGQHITQGQSYYTASGWQMTASHGYCDDAQPLALVNWYYSAPTIPTVQNGGAATANVQLELCRGDGVAGNGNSLFTLTASSASGNDALGKTQYSATGGGVSIVAGDFLWARVPAAANQSWKAPPGAHWRLMFARIL